MTHTRGADAPTWRFRRLAALYPSSWLAEHGEAYVGTMLDVADAEGRTGPVARDWVSALRHAAGVWSAELGRRARAERGLRSFGIVGEAALVSGSALSSLALVLGELAPDRLLPGTGPHWPAGYGSRTTGTLVYVLWLAALGLVAAGRTPPARRLLAAATVLPGLLFVVRALGGPDRPTAGMTVALTVFAGAAALAPAPSRRGRIALVATTVAVCAGATAWILVAWSSSPYREYSLPLGFGFYRQTGLPALAEPIAWLVAAAALVGVLTVPVRPGLLLAAAVVGTPWLWLAFSTRSHLRQDAALVQGPLQLGVVAAPGLLAGVVALAAAAWRLRKAR